MTHELIDIVDRHGIPIGKIVPKSEIHTKGYYHNTVHIWLYTKERHILLAQRSASKTIFPLLWDVSVAGHVDAGETLEMGAIREVREEIGMKITKSELEKIGVFECFQTYGNGIIDNEFHHTFLVELNVDIKALVRQKEEVEALRLVTFEEFQDILDTIGENNHFVPSNRAYYELVLNAIAKKCL